MIENCIITMAELNSHKQNCNMLVEKCWWDVSSLSELVADCASSSPPTPPAAVVAAQTARFCRTDTDQASREAAAAAAAAAVFRENGRQIF